MDKKKNTSSASSLAAVCDATLIRAKLLSPAQDVPSKKRRYVMRHKKVPVWELIASAMGTNPKSDTRCLIRVPVDCKMPWQVCVWFGFKFVVVKIPHSKRQPTVAWLVRKAVAEYVSTYRLERPPDVQALIKEDGSALLFPGFRELKPRLRDFEMMVAVYNNPDGFVCPMEAFKIWSTVKKFAVLMEQNVIEKCKRKFPH